MRGQPPHIGHILTIVRIYDEYDKIILHVAGKTGKHYRHEDFIIPPEEVVAALREIFKHMPKVEVILGDMLLRERTAFDDLPHFDVIITGNKDFIKTTKSDKPIRFIRRSTIGGYDISGTAIRKIISAQDNHATPDTRS
jgi:nicotinamide mononucleotide adenylyltransferase